MVQDACGVILLLLAGGVESDLGPPDRATTLINDMQTVLQESIEKIASSQLVLEETMNARLAELNNTLKVIAQHAEEISDLKLEVCSLKKLVHEQQVKLDDLEDSSRRCNLMIFGIPKTPYEIHFTEHVVDKIFCEKLDVVTKTVERVHRVGKK